MEKPKSVDLFAFWKYDTFPVLGSRATKMDSTGRVYLPSYQGWVKPVLLLPRKAGEALHAKLEKVRAQHDADIKGANLKMREAVAELIDTQRASR